MPLQPPPTDKRFTSADEAFKALQAHARDQGYAVVETRPSDYKDGKPRRYDIACMKIVQRKDADDLWVPGILCDSHNHDASSAISFPEHRRGALTVEQTKVLRALLGHSKLTLKTIGEIIKLQFPDILLTEKDISNLRQPFNRMSNASSSRTVDGLNQ
ncbi:hypothetical protein A9Z42_0057830 [Trichoderma parareesei]|uniref:FAR1 domain-containing protein n=1 Tax=Trichoderma parareesei TaxID=858221 RepID=A0A2H2ZPQ6_TRIPA|nr:hypothetical protein A9Z42_0057830 [Trichoderma parareesei]